MHHIRYSLRHSTPHGTQPAAEGQHSIPHGTQPAVDRWHPPQHGVLPAAFGQYPNSTASSTQSIRIGFAMILQRPYGAESSRRPRFAGHQPCMHLHPANRQIKNRPGPKWIPAVSRCGLCRWQGGVAPAATAPTRCHCISGTSTPVPAATAPTRRRYFSGASTPVPAGARTQSCYCSSL